MTDASPPKSPETPAARAIAKLNRQLLALADTEDTVPTVEIERTAKAITSLIRSVEHAQGFLAAQGGAEVAGARLSPERHRQLMLRIRQAVEEGLLSGEQTK